MQYRYAAEEYYLIGDLERARQCTKALEDDKQHAPAAELYLRFGDLESATRCTAALEAEAKQSLAAAYDKYERHAASGALINVGLLWKRIITEAEMRSREIHRMVRTQQERDRPL